MTKKNAKRKPAKKKPAKKTKKKTGRPPRKWTAKQLKEIEKFARDNCAQHEIAEYLECCQASVSDRLKDPPRVDDPEFVFAYKKGHAGFILDLRTKQAEIMRDGSALKNQLGMCIWLGKQELGQRETPEPKPDERRYSYAVPVPGGVLFIPDGANVNDTLTEHFSAAQSEKA